MRERDFLGECRRIVIDDILLADGQAKRRTQGMAGEEFVAGTDKPSSRITARDVRERSQPPPLVRCLGRVTFSAIRQSEPPAPATWEVAAIYGILIESDHSSPRKLLKKYVCGVGKNSGIRGMKTITSGIESYYCRPSHPCVLQRVIMGRKL